MARGVVLADVGLDLDDEAARNGGLPAMNQNLAEQIARHVEGRAVVERARQLAQDGRRAAAPSRAAARVAACATRGSLSRTIVSTIGRAAWSPDTPNASAMSRRIAASGF